MPIPTEPCADSSRTIPKSNRKASIFLIGALVGLTGFLICQTAEIVFSHHQHSAVAEIYTKPVSIPLAQIMAREKDRAIMVEAKASYAWAINHLREKIKAGATNGDFAISHGCSPGNNRQQQLLIGWLRQNGFDARSQYFSGLQEQREACEITVNLSPLYK